LGSAFAVRSVCECAEMVLTGEGEIHQAPPPSGKLERGVEFGDFPGVDQNIITASLFMQTSSLYPCLPLKVSTRASFLLRSELTLRFSVCLEQTQFSSSSVMMLFRVHG
jgi:hypothetical protein